MSTYTSILVGIDFTPSAKVALGHALRLGRKTGAGVRAVHVIETMVVIELEDSLSPMQHGVRDSLLNNARKAWETFSQGVEGVSGVPLDVVINSRIAGIRQAAASAKADLLVVGAFGDRRPELGMGTVATVCVRHAPIDVLVVRDTHAGPFTTVIAGVDFSDASFAAARSAARLAAADGARLHVVHVFEAPWNRLRFESPAMRTAQDIRTQYADVLRTRLEAFVAPLRAEFPGLSMAESLHDAKGHRSELTEFARSIEADLLVVGTRGKTNLRDVMLGSTAEKALTDSTCAVLAVRTAG